MMRKAGRYHVGRGLMAVLLALFGWGVHEAHGTLKAHALRERLLHANTNEVPTIVGDMTSYRRWLNPLLQNAYHEAEASKEARKQLHTSLALLPVDPGQVEYLYQRLLNAAPTELPVIRDALAGHRDVLVERLWNLVGDRQADPEPRFRAACALAGYDASNSEPWQGASKFVADHLLLSVQKNPSHYSPLLETLRPIRDKLLGPLAEVYRNRERPDSERGFATNFLADYAADQRQSPRRSPHGCERQAVCRPVSEVQGTARGWPALVDRRSRPETTPGCDGGRQGKIGQAAGECGSGLAQNGPA